MAQDPQSQTPVDSDDLQDSAAIAAPPEQGLAKFFKFSELQTNIRTEVIAGFTTFFTMAYILAVNPGILSNAVFLQESGDLFGELVIATALSSAIATLVMGLYANYPFALAPGMGLNAYFAFSIVLEGGIDWRIALAAVLIEGLIFIALTLGNIRTYIVEAIPECIRHATAAGIGLFIAYIGLSGAGIIVSSDATNTTLGDLSQPSTLMAIVGLLVTAAFMARRIIGALLWGILATAILGWIIQAAPLPEGIVAIPQMPVDLIGQAFVGLGQVTQVNPLELFAIVFVLLFVDLFDTVGTLTGLGTKAGYIRENGEFPRVNRAFMADAIGTTVGAMLGTSTVTSYIESASGVLEGGRSGFTSVVVAVLFVLSIFFIPLLAGIPVFATAPALIIVGALMISAVTFIRWGDPAEAIPSFLTIIIMPLSYSIADGLAAGFIVYPLVKTFQGKAHEVSVGVWVLAALFFFKFAIA